MKACLYEELEDQVVRCHLCHHRCPMTSVKLSDDIGKKAGLKYVYIGNVFAEKGENTWCAHCNAPLIECWGYTVKLNHIVEVRCPIGKEIDRRPRTTDVSDRAGSTGAGHQGRN